MGGSSAKLQFSHAQTRSHLQPALQPSSPLLPRIIYPPSTLPLPLPGPPIPKMHGTTHAMRLGPLTPLYPCKSTPEGRRILRQRFPHKYDTKIQLVLLSFYFIMTLIWLWVWYSKRREARREERRLPFWREKDRQEERDQAPGWEPNVHAGKVSRKKGRERGSMWLIRYSSFDGVKRPQFSDPKFRSRVYATTCWHN